MRDYNNFENYNRSHEDIAEHNLETINNIDEKFNNLIETIEAGVSALKSLHKREISALKSLDKDFESEDDMVDTIAEFTASIMGVSHHYNLISEGFSAIAEQIKDFSSMHNSAIEEILGMPIDKIQKDVEKFTGKDYDTLMLSTLLH